MPDRPTLFGKVLCRLGLHDLSLVSKTFVGTEGSVETLECKRCGRTATRKEDPCATGKNSE